MTGCQVHISNQKFCIHPSRGRVRQFSN